MLTVGPLLFNWPAARWRDFYARLADEAPVDRVVLGELVCSKRLPFYQDMIPEAIERLERAGKEVLLTSLALVTLPRERKSAAELMAGDGPGVEINDLTLLRWAGADKPFAVGPLVNAYNESTLRLLARRGANAVSLPPELPFASVQLLAAECARLGMACEVWAYGRVPLAVSGRCYHARIHGLAKDNCQFVCDRDPEGLEVDTMDGQRFLAINGIQTLSYNCASLLGDLAVLQAAGVNRLRLSPQGGDFVAVTQAFRAVLDGRMALDEAEAALRAAQPETMAQVPFSRGFLFEACGAA